jgi:hypothetical protein
MKRIIIILGLLIVTTFVAKAATIDFTLDITDSQTCSGSPWTGDYCAYIYIMEGSTTQWCTTTICNLRTGSNHIQYECSIEYEENNPNYKLFVKVCRNVTNPPYCCSLLLDSNSFDYFYNFTNNYYTLYATL